MSLAAFASDDESRALSELLKGDEACGSSSSAGCIIVQFRKTFRFHFCFRLRTCADFAIDANAWDGSTAGRSGGWRARHASCGTRSYGEVIAVA